MLMQIQLILQRNKNLIWLEMKTVTMSKFIGTPHSCESSNRLNHFQDKMTSSLIPEYEHLKKDFFYYCSFEENRHTGN